MNEEMNTTTQGEPLWGAANDLDKQEKRDLLFKETGGCCMICGKPRSDNDEWSIVQIIPEKKPRYVQLDGRTIICHDCVVQKGRASIPLFASSRPFADRFGYWWRVQTGYMSGHISPEKKNLLQREFSLLRRNTDTAVRKGTTTYLNLLMEETCGTCIYCGVPLAQHEMTYDNLFPKCVEENQRWKITSFPAMIATTLKATSPWMFLSGVGPIKDKSVLHIGSMTFSAPAGCQRRKQRCC